MHGVSPDLVVEHQYGESWCVEFNQGTKVELTFEDANHCPGAAVVFVEVHNDETTTTHLHTGDFRYHHRMKDYASFTTRRRQVDILYLDTTYAHPKHTFVQQKLAIEQVASVVHNELATNNNNTLIMLSCYSIGKERVVWECSQRTNQRIYGSEKKLKMISCLVEEGISTDDQDLEACHQLIQRTTDNPNDSDLHIVPMGLAGEMFPYFVPNYYACAEYAWNLTKSYTKVLAVIPTGHAGASNWNLKNAICQRRISPKPSKPHGESQPIDVEIRLVPYSEHSSFDELCDFVEFVRPRKVVPTVFSSTKKNDQDIISKRFQQYIDTGRAKQSFFKSFTPTKVTNNEISQTPETFHKESSDVQGTCHRYKPEVIEINDDNNDIDPIDPKLAHIISMGFDKEKSRIMLHRNKGDVAQAIEDLLRTPANHDLLPETPKKRRRSQNPAKLETFFGSANSSSMNRAQK